MGYSQFFVVSVRRDYSIYYRWGYTADRAFISRRYDTFNNVDCLQNEFKITTVQNPIFLRRKFVSELKKQTKLKPVALEVNGITKQWYPLQPNVVYKAFQTAKLLA
jgi:hypothetical protein